LLSRIASAPSNTWVTLTPDAGAAVVQHVLDDQELFAVGVSSYDADPTTMNRVAESHR